ncbi:hypothetical protein [Nocardia blacklockiae]|uniref:hypothetical protein n=1 Tax=Nocardia blacklockiae TaxID=480036 RepID=UPI001E5E899E|nr:hypothetical protein [Nocardia blacklockiae]
MGSSAALAATALVAGATVLGTAGPAAAESSGGQFTRVYSLANGPCVAIVDSSVNGNAYPGAAGFTASVTLIGVGSCSLDVTLNWRNVATGETGSKTHHANGPGYWSNDGRSSLFSPGYGDFVGTVTVGAAHVPEPGELPFTVHPYQG